jgi:molybdopterin molybdotransferase
MHLSFFLSAFISNFALLLKITIQFVEMITFEEAYNIVISTAKVTGTEEVLLEKSLGRVLASDVYSDMDMPPFHRSAMDGYACRRADLENELEVIETIAAGEMPSKTVGVNQCTKIMTGASLPVGADCVIMFEHTKVTGENRVRFTEKGTADNYARKGEDIKKGELVMSKGTVLKPQHIALIASVGCHKPVVSKQVRIGVISTGSELVEPSEIPLPAQIRNSNAYQLMAQVERATAIPVYYGIAKDDPLITETIINKALSECDIIILTGGVSMGDFDFVPEILKKNNVQILFEKLNVKPGRPTVFGTTGNKYVFGLPGNPVSCFVMFEMLVKPLIYEMMGHRYSPSNIFMPLAKDHYRRKTDRLTFELVTFTKDGQLDFVEYHGSAHVHSVCNADGIFIMQAGLSEIKKGEFVHVRQI